MTISWKLEGVFPGSERAFRVDNAQQLRTASVCVCVNLSDRNLTEICASFLLFMTT